MADAKRDVTVSIGMDRRKVMLGLGLLSVATFAQARLPVPNSPALKEGWIDSRMPDRIGQWSFVTESGLVLPPIDALSDRIYDNLVTRIYRNPAGDVVMILIAYNNRQDGVLQIHRPEVCYPAGGFVLSETTAVDVALPSGAILPSRTFSARGNSRDESILYWTRVGDEFPQRWAEQRLTVAEANLRGIIPDGLLARVSVVGGELEHSLPIMEQFVADLYKASPKQLKGLLFGTV